MLLDEIDALTARIDQLTVRSEALIATLPGASAPPPSDPSNPDGPHAGGLGALERLDEVPGIGLLAAQVVIAEVGLNMAQFPTPAHLVSWTRLSPRTIQSGAKTHSGKTGKGNPYLKGVLGEVAAAAARTDTFLGERYRRLVRRVGKQKALVAVARSILVIIWHLLADPTARFIDLGADHYHQHIDKNRKTRNLVRQLQALGHQVTLNPGA
jgi:transposase